MGSGLRELVEGLALAERVKMIQIGGATGRIIPYEMIDIADLDKTNVLLRYEITFRGQLLFGDELDYLELKSAAFREYIDEKGLRELETCLINKRQRLIMDALTEITSK